MTNTRTRKPRPHYEIEVDKMLFRYADYQVGLELQYAKLNDLQAILNAGRRTTAIYEKLEGSGGEFRVQEEDIVIMLISIEERIKSMEKYILATEGLINFAFKDDEDKKEFIKEYWFQNIPRDIRTRKRVVLSAMPFLTHDSFYDWRNKIYIRLAEVAGFEAEKEAGPGE